MTTTDCCIKCLHVLGERLEHKYADERPDGLFEPGGLALGLGRLWVADTNHHEVKVIDLTTGAARALSRSPL
jgi:hypothetical protein